MVAAGDDPFRVSGTEDSSKGRRLLHSLMEPAIRTWLRKRGLVAGDFSGTRNLYDVIQDDAFQRDLSEAMYGAAQADRPTFERLMKGFTRLAGKEWTPGLEKHVKSLSGDIAQIAPYVQRWAPDVWDELHGSRGSVASLTSAIAEANRNRLSPLDAHRQAQEIHKALYSDADPMRTRGFSSRDMGKIYADLVRRGRISPFDDAPTIAQRLGQYAGPLSAVRDTLSAQGPTSLEDVLAAAPSILTPELEELGLDQAELRLRQGDLLNRHGGLYSMSARNTGLPPGQDLQQLELKDRQLRDQAAESPIGNMIAATQRLSQEVGFTPGSEIAQLHQNMLSGQVGVQHPQEWLEVASRSGINPQLAQTILGQTQRNHKFITPELIDTVRRGQMAGDLQPRALRYTAGLTSPAAIAGAQDQAASEMGYTDWNNVEALHGKPVQQTGKYLDQAKQQATTSSQLSGFASQGPIQRTVDAIGGATPQTTLPDLAKKFFNVVPKNELPGGKVPVALCLVNLH